MYLIRLIYFVSEIKRHQSENGKGERCVKEWPENRGTGYILFFVLLIKFSSELACNLLNFSV